MDTKADTQLESISIGRRIHVIGNSCSGKSTLAQQISEQFEIPFVELDALNWGADWVGLNETNPAELEQRIKDSTSGGEWVVAGSYESFSKRVFWPQLQTIVWLDFPLPTLVLRMVKRSWRRWRSEELLWGKNREKFWPQLMFWRKEESLLWWIVTQYQRKREGMLENMADPEWGHIEFIQLRSLKEVQKFLLSVKKKAIKQTINSN